MAITVLFPDQEDVNGGRLSSSVQLVNIFVPSDKFFKRKFINGQPGFKDSIFYSFVT